MNTNVREIGGVGVLSLDGRLDASNAETVKQLYRDKLVPFTKLVIDLSRLEYLDSTGLSALVFCLKSCNENGGELKLCGLRPKPRLIFNITRAHKLFQIYDDWYQAFAAFDVSPEAN